MKRTAVGIAAIVALLVCTAPASTQEAWPRSTPGEQGLVAAPLEQLTARMREGGFGNVDRLVVVRNGFLVLDERFPTDYRSISRGRTGALGCGVDACTDSAQLQPYNYPPGYGYQWWRYDRRGTEVWAGNGFGGQFLVIVPSMRMVGVVQSWNVFGAQVPGVLGPFLDALLTAGGVAPSAGR